MSLHLKSDYILCEYTTKAERKLNTFYCKNLLIRQLIKCFQPIFFQRVCTCLITSTHFQRKRLDGTLDRTRWRKNEKQFSPNKRLRLEIYYESRQVILKAMWINLANVSRLKKTAHASPRVCGDYRLILILITIIMNEILIVCNWLIHLPVAALLKLLFEIICRLCRKRTPRNLLSRLICCILALVHPVFLLQCFNTRD